MGYEVLIVRLLGFGFEGSGFLSFDLCVLGCIYVCICVYFGGFRFDLWFRFELWVVSVCGCWVSQGSELNPGRVIVPGLDSFRM